MASNVFSMQGEAQPSVEGTQLGLDQGPGRGGKNQGKKKGKKPPTLLIETTQIFLSDLLPCFSSKSRREGLLQTARASNGNSRSTQPEKEKKKKENSHSNQLIVYGYSGVNLLFMLKMQTLRNAACGSFPSLYV